MVLITDILPICFCKKRAKNILKYILLTAKVEANIYNIRYLN